MVLKPIMIMKKIFLIFCIFILQNTVTSQTTQREWTEMMENFNVDLDKILEKVKPKDLTLDKFRIALINGEKSLNETSIREIEKLLNPLKNYGREFANRNKLSSVDDSDLIFYSSLSPQLPISGGDYQNTTNSLTWAEVGNCAIAAIGVNVFYSLMYSGASTWSIASITTAFTNVAKRFIGPIGVALTVAAFGFCLADQYAD